MQRKITILRKQTFLLFSLLLLVFAAHAQEPAKNCNIQIYGKITDAKTQKPLPWATVQLKIGDTLRGVATNAEGIFRLEGICAHSSLCLHCGTLGYHTVSKCFHLHGDTTLHIQLSEKYQELQVIEIEAKADEETSASLSKVERVHQKAILSAQSLSLAEALDRRPGISTVRTGVGIAKPVIRGMRKNRILVLDRGIRQEDQQWGDDHGLLISALSAERVEIIRGAQALRYGATVGGVIHLLPPAIPQNEGVSGKFIGGYSSVNDNIEASLKLNIKKKSNFFEFHFTQSRYADYRVPAEEFLYQTFILPIPGGRLKNSAGSSHDLMLAWGRTFEKGTVRLSLSRYAQRVGIFAGAMGIPMSYNLSHDGNYWDIRLPRQENAHHKALLNLSKELRSATTLYVDLGFQDNLRNELSFPHAHGQSADTTSTEALILNLRTFSGRAWLEKTFSEQWSGEAGLNFQYMQNRVGGFEFLIPNYDRGELGAYAAMQYKFSPTLSLQASGRLETAQLWAEKGEVIFTPLFQETPVVDERSPEVNRNFTLYALALSLKNQFSSDGYWLVQLSRFARPPAVPELLTNGVHHGTFRHEQGDPSLQAEVGFQGDFSFRKMYKIFTLEGGVFSSYFGRSLYLNPEARFSPLPEGGQLYRYKQAEAMMSGFEASLAAKFTDFWRSEFSGEYVYSYNLETFLPMPFTPPGELNIVQEFSLFKERFPLQLSAESQYIFDQNRVGRNEKETPGMWLFNLRLSAEKGNWQLFVSAENLTNRIYFRHLNRYRPLGIPEPSRNFNVRVVRRFSCGK